MSSQLSNKIPSVSNSSQKKINVKIKMPAQAHTSLSWTLIAIALPPYLRTLETLCCARLSYSRLLVHVLVDHPASVLMFSILVEFRVGTNTVQIALSNKMGLDLMPLAETYPGPRIG